MKIALRHTLVLGLLATSGCVRTATEASSPAAPVSERAAREAIGASAAPAQDGEIDLPFMFFLTLAGATVHVDDTLVLDAGVPRW
jgi:hypothetical protein